MNVAELIDRYRVEILDDNITPYLWSDAECINHANDTIDELAEDNLIIKDQSTAAVTQVKLLSNQTLHAISSSIIQARFGRLNSTGYSVVKTTEDWLDANVSDWRDTTGSSPSHFAPSATNGYLSIYPKYDDTYEYEGASDIDFVALTKTVSQPTGDFSGLTAGDSVYISGTTNNNGYFTVVTVGTTSFTVSETVTGELNTSATIRRVMDTLLLTVNRMPLTPFTEADIAAATAITDVNSMHHSKLLNGMAKRAFLKPDSETYDKNKAEYHRGLFEVDKKKIKKSLIMLHKPDRALTIRSGSGIGN